ncbi:MAG: hypothetical protein K8S16_08740 [Bacteroidales bacterium]|nr:hypothetical protein [Bacteroidales bacterium]
MSNKFQNKYRIESNRWQFWDYSAPGSYHKRAFLDEWTIMPNHVHCIITLDDYDYTTNTNGGALPIIEKIHEFSLLRPTQYPTRLSNQPPTESEIKQYRKQRRKMLIPKLLGKFQMQTSKQMNILRNTPGKRNWQSNYHDHVIQNNEEYTQIKHYIINNHNDCFMYK